ncbi:MAG TPA: sugar kinase [Mycobacteriales bacterium]|nr:sugar kinase [Mycobacteriales bacterium]
MSAPLGTETLDVVVVGDVMVDVLAAMSGPLARGSDTPSAVTTAGGGSAANVAVWLAAQGVPTSYVGRVGDDALGRESVAALTDCGVTAWVSTEPDLTTGTCIVLVEPGGERSMLPDAGANATLTAADLPQRAFRPGGHLHLSGYTLLNPGSRDAGLAALSMAAAADMTVSVDPSSAAPLAELGAARFLSMTRGVDLLLANRDEAAVLAGTSDPHLAAQQLGDTYREVVVKLGADGAMWQQGFIGASAPAERGVEVVDTTGAGDAFAAGFLASWLLHPEPETALAAGCRLAARAVSRVGARP